MTVEHLSKSNADTPTSSTDGSSTYVYERMKVLEAAHNIPAIAWTSTVKKDQSNSQWQARYLQVLSGIIEWPMATYEFASYDDAQQYHSELCGEHTCDNFLNSDAYQGWKNRKTRGPDLLYVSGDGTSSYRLSLIGNMLWYILM